MMIALRQRVCENIGDGKMADTINVTIRLDREIKEQAEKMFDDFGINLSTAFNIFVRQSLRQRKIPFEIHDPFYSEKNQQELSRRIAEIEAGTTALVVKTMEELEAMKSKLMLRKNTYDDSYL